MFGSRRKEVDELRALLEEAAGRFRLLADELETVHSDLKARKKNAKHLHVLDQLAQDAEYLAGKFSGRYGTDPDPEMSAVLGGFGSVVARGVPASLLLVAGLSGSVLEATANISQILGVDAAHILETGDKAETACERVTEYSLNLLLPAGTEQEPHQPNPDDEAPQPAPDESEHASPKFDPNEIRPGVDLSNRDLGGANLGGAYLGGAYLGGANLSKADLSKANLAGTDLSGTDLSGADLRGANLGDADLSGADLSGAYLYEANLYEANLTRANLTRANLTEADLRGAKLGTANLSKANLTSADLDGADLAGANLFEAEWDPEYPPVWPEDALPPNRFMDD